MSEANRTLSTLEEKKSKQIKKIGSVGWNRI